MNGKATIDLLVMAIVFSGTWFLKTFLPIEFRGSFVVLSTSLMGVIIIRIRKLTYQEMGLIKFSIGSKFFNEVGLVALLIFLVQMIGILLVGALFGSPDPGTAITNQPQTVLGFIIDIVLMTWIVTGLGEEFIFRGIILHRLKEFFKSIGISNVFLLSGSQAIWFGLGHQSQGLSGVIITGLIGFFLGIYLLKKSKHGIWPLVVAHALVDTVVLSINFFNQ